MNENKKITNNNIIWLTTDEVCSRYRLKKGTLANWRSERKIPFYKMHNKVLYSQEEMDEYILSQKVEVLNVHKANI